MLSNVYKQYPSIEQNFSRYLILASYCSKYCSKNDQMLMYTYEIVNMHLVYGVKMNEARRLYHTFCNAEF